MPPTAKELLRRFLAVAVLTFGLGLALFALVSLDVVATADERATSTIHQFAVRHRPLPQISEALTMVGNPVTLAILVVASTALLIKAHHRRLALWLIGVTAGGALIETGLKHLIRRARPDLENVLLKAHGTSFPSGHAMNTTIALGAIALALSQATGRTPGATKAALTLAAAISILVAASRVFIGVHYLSDVTAGFLLGLFWLTVSPSGSVKGAGLHHRSHLTL